MLCAGIAYAGGTNIEEVRRMYYSAAEGGKQAEQFTKMMDGMDTKDPILLCYKGAAYMMKADSYFNPYNKLMSFRKGRAMVEDAVSKAPGAVEVRFIRFGIQVNTPSFLNYDDNIQEDKTMLINNLKTIQDTDLKERIRKYLLQSGKCTEKEKNSLL